MKLKEFFKSLIIVILTVSMLGMTATLMRGSFADGGTGKVDMSFSSVLSMLGLEFLGNAINKRTSSELMDHDFSADLYPSYVAVADGENVLVSASDDALFTAYSALLPSLCETLRAPLERSDKNFADVTLDDGTLIFFETPVSSQFFMRLFSSADASENIMIKAAFASGGKIYFWNGDKTFVSTASAAPTVDTSLFVPAYRASDAVAGCVGVLPQDNTVYGQILLSRPVYSRQKQLFDDAKIGAIASNFGFSSSALIRSIDDEGNLIYVGNLSALSISVSSVLHYYSTQFGGGMPISDILGNTDATSFSQRAVCTAAVAFLKNFSPFMGAARISDVYLQDSGEYVIEFDFAFNGLKVVPANFEKAAVFKYKNGYFTDISINLTRLYESVTQYTMEPLASMVPFIESERPLFVYAKYVEADSSTRPELSVAVR